MELPRHRWYRRFGKRTLDLVIAVPVALLSAPLQGLVALLVRFRLGSPVLFRQTRIGWREAPFAVAKFRTMTAAADATGTLLPDQQRHTPLGRWLRSTSLDELPQLWQVIAGTMSLVGPRPLLPEYLPHYSDRQQKRHLVKPGITGWAQIHGRNETSWKERLDRDVWYVEHQSFMLDLRILAITLWRVVRQDGVTAADGGTMPHFVDQQHASDGND